MKTKLFTLILLIFGLSSYGQYRVVHMDKTTNKEIPSTSGGKVEVILKSEVITPNNTNYGVVQSAKEILPPNGYLASTEIVIDAVAKKISVYSTPKPVTLPSKISLQYTHNNVVANYQGVRIGEYYWMNSNFSHVEPGGYENQFPISQAYLDNYMSLMKLDKTKFQVNISDLTKLYGSYYSPTTIDRMKNEGKMVEIGTVPDSKWYLPVISDFRQLVGMVPFLSTNTNKIMDEQDFRRGLSPNYNGSPLLVSVPGSCGATYWFSGNNDKYGFNLMPAGGRLNASGPWSTNLCNVNVTFYNRPGGDIYGLFYTAKYHADYGMFSLHDRIDTGDSWSYHLLSVRYCRRLSDKELGYKLYVKVNNLSTSSNEWGQLAAGNEIPLLKYFKTGKLSPSNVVIVKKGLTDPVPAGYVELPKGYMRGFYVQHILSVTTPLVDIPTIVKYAYSVDDNVLDLGNNKNSKLLVENQINEDSEISVSPNPVIDVLNIQSINPIISINIYDLSGKLVMKRQSESVINVQDLSVGTYVVKIETNKKTESIKIVKK